MRNHIRVSMIVVASVFGLLRWNMPYAVAQQNQRLGLGSTWKRQPFGPQPNPQNGGTVNSARPGTGQRFFGGVTVGPGVRTFPPGYFGAFYNIPGYGYAYGFPGTGYLPGVYGVGKVPSVPLPLIPYSPNSYTSPFLIGDTGIPGFSVGFGPPDAPLDIGSNREMNHAPAIPIQTSEARFDRGFVLQRPFQTAAPLTWTLIRQTVVSALEDAPVIGEYAAEVAHAEVQPDHEADTEFTKLIRSGDAAVAAGQFQAGEELYQLAIGKEAPQFHPWHRISLTHLWRNAPEMAATSLSHALSHGFDATIPVLTSDTVNRTELANSEIWEWLMAQPGSIDRLHLVAAWQAAEGNTDRARELAALAAAADVDATEHLQMLIDSSVSGLPGTTITP